MELRGFKKPPPGVDKVTQACLILLHNETKNYSWSNGKKMMAKVDGFLRSLQVFGRMHIHTYMHTDRQIDTCIHTTWTYCATINSYMS